MESPQTRDWTHVPCIGRQILIPRTTREVPEHFSAEKNGTCMQTPAGPGRNTEEWNRSVGEPRHILPTIQRHRFHPHREISCLDLSWNSQSLGCIFLFLHLGPKKILLHHKKTNNARVMTNSRLCSVLGIHRGWWGLWRTGGHMPSKGSNHCSASAHHCLEGMGLSVDKS